MYRESEEILDDLVQAVRRWANCLHPELGGSSVVIPKNLPDCGECEGCRIKALVEEWEESKKSLT